ncbi:unnamed protein product, partial [Acanthocheilonema viteae]
MSLMDFGNETDEIMIGQKPTVWQTWGIGLTIVTITAIGPSICITIVPFLSKTLYELFMTLLVAFGIGTLSGSTLYVLLPGALDLNIMEQSYYKTKISILLVVLYAFFAVDRILAYALHFRKMRLKGQKVHQSTLNKILKKNKNLNQTMVTEDNFMAARIILANDNNNGSSENDDLKYYELDKDRLKSELDAAMVSNMISRKMSCKLQTTVLTVLDDNNKTSIENGSNCKNKDRNDEVSVNVDVVEKKVLNPSELDVATVAWMIMFGSLMNNFVDGMSNGAAFANSLARGFSVGIAVIAQQLPQEIGTLAILIQSGLGFKRTLLLNLLPNSLSYLGFVVGVLIGNADDSYGNYVFAVSSGMYLYVFLGTLIPEIRDSVNEQIKVDLKKSIQSTILQAVGVDTWGSFSLTLIDSLDTLLIMGNETEFMRASEIILRTVKVDMNVNVSVFETNIRVIGGLISAHMLSGRVKGMALEPGWPCSGPLLRLAERFAQKLVPAFKSGTGMPYGTINLRHGLHKNETPITCTAGVGTMLLEFGTLSHITNLQCKFGKVSTNVLFLGNPYYEQVALKALDALWKLRSPLNLVGNHINVETGEWTATDAGIGAGVDSYFEYLAKAALLFQRP